MAEQKIYVCDDESDLREMVGEYLEKRGFGVHLAANGEELSDLITDHGVPSAVLLDINMPGDDGLTVLKKVRADHDVPVLMLTAADEVIDRVVGLEMGADDYLAKPVDLRELEARLKAVLRRIKPATEADMQPKQAGAADVEFGGFTLDMSGAKLIAPSGEQIPLTAMEFRLLQVFVRNKGRVLNRDQLLEMAHDRGWDPFDRSIDIRIMRLRKKIEPNPTQPKFIRTVRGIGYIFDPND